MRAPDSGDSWCWGLGGGFWKSTVDLERVHKVDRIFRPKGKRQDAERLYGGWKRAVAMVRTQ